MRNFIRFSSVFLLLTLYNKLSAQDTTKYIHRVSVRFEEGYVAPSGNFLKGDNFARSRINNSFSTHLKYSFSAPAGTWVDAAYGSPYQGVGISTVNFFNYREIGRPGSIYLFQGARLFYISPVLSLDYEWNLGISWGWKPYDTYFNPYNNIIGSRVNAYIATDVHLRWAATKEIDVSAGVGVSHYSNANTTIPNEGLNIFSANVEVAYNFGRSSRENTRPQRVPALQRHFVYELMAFGGWKRRGIDFDNVALEHKYMGRSFAIGGISFAPLRVLSRRFRAGASLDIAFDRSRGTKFLIRSEEIHYTFPAFYEQLSLGLAGRMDYTMPYCAVSTTLGYKLIDPYGSKNGVYQTIALKINVVENTFLNVGYSTVQFTKANYLMLGAGYLFK